MDRWTPSIKEWLCSLAQLLSSIALWKLGFPPTPTLRKTFTSLPCFTFQELIITGFMAYMMTPTSHGMLFSSGQFCFAPQNQVEKLLWPRGMTTRGAYEFWVLPVLLFSVQRCAIYIPFLDARSFICKKCLKAKFLQVLLLFMQWF